MTLFLFFFLPKETRRTRIEHVSSIFLGEEPVFDDSEKDDDDDGKKKKNQTHHQIAHLKKKKIPSLLPLHLYTKTPKQTRSRSAS